MPAMLSTPDSVELRGARGRGALGGSVGQNRALAGTKWQGACVCYATHAQAGALDNPRFVPSHGITPHPSTTHESPPWFQAREPNTKPTSRVTAMRTSW